MEITIYQIHSKFRDTKYTFLPWDMAKEFFNIEDYDMIDQFLYIPKPGINSDYSCIFEEADIMRYLDRLFAASNKGELSLAHSMSVSDVVRVDEDFYYCDSYGWTKVNV